MGEVVKNWNNGGSLSVAYTGIGDGNAVISSSKNVGDEREMEVTCVDASRSVIVVRKVVQAAMAEVVETYTRLTYIEATGSQYINTGYVVQEDDIIDMYYISTSTTSADKALFGVAESGNGIWATIYSNTSYLRFGSTASETISNARMRYKITLKKGSADIDGSTASPVFAAMPAIPLYIFASNNNNNKVNMYGYCQSMGVKISKGNGDVVINLKPCKRDSDGKIGMLDLVSGQFFTNQGVEDDFIGGSEMQMSSEYEAIDYVTFNKDKGFDTGYYGNESTSIDVMFARTNTSSSQYLFGCSSGNRLTAYIANSSGYWRYGSAYPTFSLPTTKISYGQVTPGKTTVDFTLRSFSFSAFTTSYTIPLGGHKASAGTIAKTFIGRVYFFRMWHGDTLLLDWYPCRRLSDGVEGFWDCVSQSFVEPIS